MRINLVGPCNFLGYGLTVMNILKALHSNGHEVSLWPIGPGEAHPDNHAVINGAVARTKDYDNHAPSIRIFHQFDLALHVGRGMHVGFPIFELDKFKDNELHHMGNQDRLFVCSKWAKSIVEENNITVPVHVVPLGVDREIFNEKLAGPKTEDTVFFNAGKWEIRKAHDIILEAFSMAFTAKDNVRLLMNCNDPLPRQENKTWEDMYLNSPLGKAGKIHVMKHRLATQQELAQLMAKSDCGVFPAKAEGWNMELLEMMSCGKHVIATNYSGHTEFATKENALLIECPRREQAYDGKWFDGAGNWAELGSDEIDCLVAHMRDVHKRKQDGVLSLNADGIATAKAFSWDNTVTHLIRGVQ